MNSHCYARLPAGSIRERRAISGTKDDHDHAGGHSIMRDVQEDFSRRRRCLDKRQLRTFVPCKCKLCRGTRHLPAVRQSGGVQRRLPSSWLQVRWKSRHEQQRSFSYYSSISQPAPGKYCAAGFSSASIYVNNASGRAFFAQEW